MSKPINVRGDSPLKTFKEYLEQQGYAGTSAEKYQYQSGDFLKWCSRSHTTPAMVDYKQCLKYIQYLQRKQVGKKTINLYLGVVKKYLDYQVSEALRADNPIEGITVRGTKRTINHNLLEAEELEDLYYSFETDNQQEQYHVYTAKRNKIIVGFMVYQGLDTKDLKLLRTEHLQLSKGRLYVPGTRKSNARELELKPWQIMELMEYMGEVRARLLERTADTDYLFPYDGRRFVVTNAIIKKLKKLNQKVRDSRHLRASVITLWLKQYNLRKVQYLAGHRYISSTERYLQDDLENLHEMINHFHPIQ